MSQGAWLREEQTDLAVGRILAAAGEAFARLGVGRVTMSDVAAHAGCSRGTIYRYFKTRDELHVAYVTHRAREVSAEVAGIVAPITDPVERLTATVLESVRAVRARPDLSVWFDAGQAGHTARLSGRPELYEALADGIATSLGDADRPAAGRREPLRWIVRVIVSLLAMPGASDEEERTIVSRFVVPGILADGPAGALSR